jgi:hypothetical protein
MEKTAEQLRQEAADLLRRAEEIERVGKQQKPTSPNPEAESQPPPAPVNSAFFAKAKTEKKKWLAHEICSDATKEQIDKTLEE